MKMDRREDVLETLEVAFKSFPEEMKYFMDNDGYGPTIFVFATRMCFALKRYDQGTKLIRKAVEICHIAKGILDLPLIGKMFTLPANLELYPVV